MTNKALYELDTIMDDPRYEGFAFARRGTLRGSCGGKGQLSDDFDPDAEEIQARGRAWRAPRIAPCWIPQRVIGRVRSFNDYPTVGGSVPAFSRRAVDALRDFLQSNGELLPLISKVGEYYAYNVTSVVDILDPEKSRVNGPGRPWLPELEDPKNQRYECMAEKMAGLSIFRLVDDFVRVYVAQPFVDRVSAHGLQGFRFIKLWPLPPGRARLEFDLIEPRYLNLVETRTGRRRIKGNALVVCIELAGEKATPAERRRTKKLMNELDTMLQDPAAPADARYFGSLEGDEFIDGESRLFLSCPDADALLSKLHPWLKELSREVPIKVLKRYGEYVDGDAPGEWVDL